MSVVETKGQSGAMSPKEQWALICSLVKAMEEAKSWVGETHIQKCVYFLQAMFGVNAGFRFLLYKFGPFSFELQRELSDMEGRRYLDIKSRHPYGASFGLAKRGKASLPNAEKHQRVVKFVADEVSAGQVRDLERLSMALLTLKRNPGAADSTIVGKVIDHKPHLKPEDVYKAIRRTRELHSKAEDMELPVTPLEQGSSSPA